jgi:hypothetical protein
MTYVLPPVADPTALLTELRFVSPAERDDVVQEAWAAHLAGRDPARAIATFAQRTRRNRKREKRNSVLIAVM